MQIKRIESKEYSKVLSLVLDVFMEYEAPEYSAEGIETFRAFVQDESVLDGLVLFGAYVKEKLVGVIATRKNGSHISLFFVHSDYHRQGIGRKLFETVVRHCPTQTITVHSSPYAVNVYRKLGFIDTDVEQLEDGIRYTPMVYHKGSRKERLYEKLARGRDRQSN